MQEQQLAALTNPNRTREGVDGDVETPAEEQPVQRIPHSQVRADLRLAEIVLLMCERPLGKSAEGQHARWFGLKGTVPAQAVFGFCPVLLQLSLSKGIHQG